MSESEEKKKVYISASKMNALDWCPKSFKYKYIDHVEEAKGKLAIEGTDIHEIFYLAYDSVDMDRMKKFDVKVVDATRSQPYYYLKELALSKLAEPNEYYKRHIKNWALFIAQYFVNLRNNYDWNQVERFFKPLYLEQEITDEENGLIGIIDLGLRFPVNGEEGILILDYKTGKVPVDVIRATVEAINGGKKRTPTIKTSYNRQLALYAWLAHVQTGEPLDRIKVGILWTSHYNKFGNMTRRYTPYTTVKSVASVTNTKMWEMVSKTRFALEHPDEVDFTPKYNKYFCEGQYARPPNPCGFCSICYRQHELEAMKNDVLGDWGY